MFMNSLSRCALLLGLLSPLASAETFQSEVRAQYDDVGSTSLQGEGRVVQLEASYYLTPVDAGTTPLSEAVFVSRASSLSLGYMDGRTDGASRTGTVDLYYPFEPQGSSTDAVFLEGIYIDASSGWFAGAEVFREELDLGGRAVDTKAFRLTLGKYLADTTTLAVDVSRSNSDPEQRYALETDTKGYGVSLRHLGVWSGYHYAASLFYARETQEYSAGDSQIPALIGFFPEAVSAIEPALLLPPDIDSDLYGAAFSFYPAATTRITLASQLRRSVWDMDSYSLELEHFISAGLAVYGRYEQVDYREAVTVLLGWSPDTCGPGPHLVPVPVCGLALTPYYEDGSLDTEVFSAGVRLRF